MQEGIPEITQRLKDHVFLSLALVLVTNSKAWLLILKARASCPYASVCPLVHGILFPCSPKLSTFCSLACPTTVISSLHVLQNSSVSSSLSQICSTNMVSPMFLVTLCKPGPSPPNSPFFLPLTRAPPLLIPGLSVPKDKSISLSGLVTFLVAMEEPLTRATEGRKVWRDASELGLH